MYSTERTREKMPVEKSAGAIIFQKNKTIEYLLLHYPSSSKSAKDYWDFPKGYIEKGEKEIETVKREVKEETNLTDLKFIEGFKQDIRYFFEFKGKTIFKIVTFYLAKTETREVRTSFEHIGFKWFSFQKAISALTFESAKNILNKANDFLKKHEN